MLEVNGIKIEKLPFDGMILINELMSFEGVPMITHYRDNKDNDLIGYWVDFDDNKVRWIYTKITKRELFEYLLGGKSLRDLFLKIKSDYIFLTDYGIRKNIDSVIMINSDNIPDEYLPKEESYYLEDLPEYYSDFLKEYVYINKLREKSYIVKVTPSDLVHHQTVSAKEAAFVLNGFCNSMEGYIKVTAFNLLKEKFGDVSKINTRINKIKSILSPRISEAAFNSFEVWLAMDVVVFTGEDEIDTKLRDDLVDNYKKDVLDADFTSEAAADIIAQKFTKDERKLIYEPIIKIIEKDDFYVSYSDHSRVIKTRAKIKSGFRDIILPKPTLEEAIEYLDRKNKIISIVLNLKEGEDVTKLSKKELFENLLINEEVPETTYKIKSPVMSDGVEVSITMPILCTLSLDSKGNLQLYNSNLELFAEGNDIHNVISEIKKQFIELYTNFTQNPGRADLRFVELQKYI